MVPKIIRNENDIIRKKPTSWSENLTEEIQTAYPDRVWSYNADNIGILIDMTLVALGRTSKNLSKNILRRHVLAQLKALGCYIGSQRRNKKA